MALAIDRSIIGKEFDHTKHRPVTTAEIRAYAEACGEELGADDTVAAPTTFPLSLRMRHFMPPELLQVGRAGFDAGKDMELGAPVRAGDVLTSVSVVHDIYEKTGRSGTMNFIVFRTTVTNQRDEMVAIIDQKMMFR
jgi:acyl dehydratase